MSYNQLSCSRRRTHTENRRQITGTARTTENRAIGAFSRLPDVRSSMFKQRSDLIVIKPVELDSCEGGDGEPGDRRPTPRSSVLDRDTGRRPNQPSA